MVGRKFLMALVREFQELCQVLSCQSVQTSPSHSNTYSRFELHEPNIGSLSPIKEEAEDEDVSYEMGNKPLKFPECDASAYQEHVLNILRQEKAPLKESNFSPYAPLPAIGKSSFETAQPHNQTDLEITTAHNKIDVKATKLHKIERQLTYRVLDPIYVKGPYDLHKFPSIKSSFMVEDGVLKRIPACLNNNSPREKNLVKINGRECKKKQVKFSNTVQSVPGRSVQPSKQFLMDKQKLQSTDVNKENTSAFWIEF